MAKSTITYRIGATDQIPMNEGLIKRLFFNYMSRWWMHYVLN